MRTAVASLIPLVLASVAAAQRPAAPRDIVARAVAAMGGEQALRGVGVVTTQFYNSVYALGQEETPQSPARANAGVATLVIDFANNRAVFALETRNVGGQVNRVRRVLAGDIGMVENNQNQLNPAGPGLVRNDQTGVRRSPHKLLLAALDAPQTLAAVPAKSWRGETMDGVHYVSGPDTLDLWFDRRSGLLTVIEATTDDPILGDRRTATILTRWQPAGGVLFARQSDTEVNGRPNTSTVTTAVTVAASAADSLFAIPDSIRTRALPATTPPPAVTVTLVELAPGVWRAEGGTHHSLVVDQGATLLVIEAPQTTARFQAVLDTLKGRFPGKPVGTVVNTHHHWDHAGGLRAAFAAGLPVVTHARNEAFVRGIATTKKTVAPDALSRAPKAPVVRTMTDSMVLGTGAGQVVLYRVPTVHVEGLLAAYVPSARVLFTSDALAGGPTLPQPGSAEMVALARARGLAVEKYAGGHGTVAAWADVERAAATAAP